MADSDNKPTEEQVNEANAAEEARWQGDFNDADLAIPYKRDEAPKEEGTSEDTPAPEKKDDEEEVVPAPVVPDEPAPVVTAPDPGDFKPGDYSFEVTLKDGKTKKVTTPEEAEAIGDDPDNFETPKQLMDFIRKAGKMETSLERDKEKWEASKKTFEEQLQEETTRREVVDTLTSEITYLVEKGLMPAIDPQYLNADWSDPEVAKQPGVKEQLALLDYMVKENKARNKAGVKPITSGVDAFNAWQLDTDRKKEVADAKAAGEARKAAGAKVAGVSPAQQGSYVPKGIAVGNPNALKRSTSVWDD